MKRWFFNLIAKSNGRQLIVLLAASTIAFILGLTICKDDNFTWIEMTNLFLDPSSFAESKTNAGIRLVFAIFGFFVFSSLLVSVFTNIFDNITDAARSGRTRYRVKNHILILGAGHQLSGILSAVKEDGKKRIVVVSSQDLDLCDDFIYYKGDFDDKDVLRSVRADQCKAIYIIGEDGPNHDPRNLHCLESLNDILKNSSRKIHCYLTLSDLVTSEIFYSLKTKPNYNHLLVDIFNEQEFMVEQLLVEKDFLPLIKINDDYRSHVVIFGSGNAAKAVAYTVAQVSHYANFKRTGLKTCITFINENCKKWMDSLKAARPGLFDLSRYTYIDSQGTKNIHQPNASKGDFLDIEWQFVDTYDDSELAKQLLTNIIENKNEKLSICVCHENTSEAIATTMHLPQIVYGKANIALYWNESSDEIIRQLNQSNKCGKIYLLGKCGNIKYVDTERVKRGQRANYIYESHLDPKIQQADAESEWYKLSEAHKNSSMYCANAMILRRKSFESASLEDHCDAEHRRWMISILLMGINEHKDIMPYDDLPQDEKNKDVIFINNTDYIVDGEKEG